MLLYAASPLMVKRSHNWNSAMSRTDSSCSVGSDFGCASTSNTFIVSRYFICSTVSFTLFSWSASTSLFSYAVCSSLLLKPETTNAAFSLPSFAGLPFPRHISMNMVTAILTIQMIVLTIFIANMTMLITSLPIILTILTTILITDSPDIQSDKELKE